MAPEQINKKCAELDGNLIEYKTKEYASSYDAILPLIQKQTKEAFLTMSRFFCEKDNESETYLELFLKQKPLQLREALLRSMNKWKES